MGPPKNIETSKTLRPRKVHLSYSFLVAATETTIAHWLRVYSSLPNQFCGSDADPQGLSLYHPVRCVSWCDAVLFANAVSEMDGLNPAYTVGDHFNTEMTAIDCNERAQFVQLDSQANGWRLPTEAEWEIAAHGAQAEPTSYLSGGEIISSVGWYADNAQGMVHPVGGKKANLLGLFDMSGNLFEWNWERFSSFDRSEVTDPFHFEVPIPYTYTRPIKGGGFNSKETGLLIYNRANASPSLRHHTVGFRLVRRWDKKNTQAE